MFFRDRFPILEKKTYLASHSLGAVPKDAENALRAYYREWANEGILAWDGEWWKIIERFTSKVAKIFGVEEGTVIPMENVTRGFAAIASAMDWSTEVGGRKKNKIVLTSLEFITSYPFWQGWAEMVGARIVIVESEDGVSIPVERLCEAIDDETLLVPTSHVYFRSGAVQDLKTIVERAHQVGAFVLGDGYQAVGIVPMDLTKMGIDFYVGGSHKWLCGGPGAGYLYIRKDHSETLVPKFSGWFGIQDPFQYDAKTRFRPATGAMRFMAGTPSIPALYAAIEGVSLVAGLGLEKIRTHSLDLTCSIIREADRRGLKVKTPRDPELRSGMVCVDFPNAKEATDVLNAEGIVVDYRPNCGIRVSPHFYNGMGDLEKFWLSLDRLL